MCVYMVCEYGYPEGCPCSHDLGDIVAMLGINLIINIDVMDDLKDVHIELGILN